MSKNFKPAVKWFAGEMCRTLALERNQKKVHWINCRWDFLLDKLRDEVGELQSALEYGDVLSEDRTNMIIHEATDVANFAMMIADNAKRRRGANGKEVRRHKQV